MKNELQQPNSNCRETEVNSVYVSIVEPTFSIVSRIFILLFFFLIYAGVVDSSEQTISCFILVVTVTKPKLRLNKWNILSWQLERTHKQIIISETVELKRLPPAYSILKLLIENEHFFEVSSEYTRSKTVLVLFYFRLAFYT